MSRDLLAAWKDGTSGNIRWISKNMEGVPEWAHGSVVEVTGAPFRVQEDAAHIEAMRLGVLAASIAAQLLKTLHHITALSGRRLI